jgi:hypothetical protein
MRDIVSFSLQHALQGWTSRRIFGEHRLVYRVSGERRELVQCRYHYWDRMCEVTHVQAFTARLPCNA